MCVLLEKSGNVSLFVEHTDCVGQAVTHAEIPIPDSFFETTNYGDKSDETETMGSEGERSENTVEANVEDINEVQILWLSDEGENELALGREKIKQYHEHIQKLRIEMEEKVDDEVLVSTKKRRYKNIKDDDGPSNKQLADNELHSDYISSSDPGSYKSTSEASDVDDAQRKRSSGLHYKPNGTFEDFFLEQIFNDSKQFKLALSEFSLKNQFAYTFKKNDSVRVRAKCSATGCKWEILASIHGNDNSFRVKTYHSEHNCLPTSKNSRVTSKIIGRKLKDDITKMPWMKARNIRALVRKQMGLTIDLPKARRAKLIVMKEIQQSYIDEFKRLREYADELLSTNIGSTVKLEVDRSTLDEPAIFHRIQLQKLEKNRKLAAVWEVDWNGGDHHEVSWENVEAQRRESYSVIIKERSCSCRGWDISGVPCQHAISAIMYEGQDPRKYLDNYFKKDVYLKAYHHMLHPVKGPMFWPKENVEEILPPYVKKVFGRPQKERRREELEGRKKVKMSRIGRKMKCSICRQEGHNKLRCPRVVDPYYQRPNIQPGKSNKYVVATSNTGSCISLGQLQEIKREKAKGKLQSSIRARDSTSFSAQESINYSLDS
nr:Zinc finger, PMZ-type [Ipomoea trifida]